MVCEAFYITFTPLMQIDEMEGVACNPDPKSSAPTPRNAKKSRSATAA
jgi:hypothetical protein